MSSHRDTAETTPRLQFAQPAHGRAGWCSASSCSSSSNTTQWWWCIAVFALAAFTDWLDGFVARKQGLTSTLGRNLDPLVDKVVICGAYIFLLQQ